MERGKAAIVNVRLFCFINRAVKNISSEILKYERIYP